MTESSNEPAAGSPATATVRDRGANALVLGFAGVMWFGWSQEGPPASWEPFLVAGSVLGAVVAVAALLFTYRHRGGPSAMGEVAGDASYLRVVGVEVAAIAVGAVVLAAVAGLTGHILPSAVAGGGGGLLMVLFGAYSLQDAWRDRRAHALR